MPFEIVRNDITRMDTDAVVNAANESLLGGGGVDGAIHRAAGPRLLEECRALGGCAPGDAKITKGYRLKAKYVIHTVGPVWRGGGYGEKETLASCYRRSLALALEHGCESVAFPLISAGAYGYPPEMAMDVAAEEIRRFLEDHDMTVYLVVFGKDDVMIGMRLFSEVKQYIDDVYAAAHADRRRGRFSDALLAPSAPRAPRQSRTCGDGKMRKKAEAVPDADWSPSDEERPSFRRNDFEDAAPSPRPLASYSAAPKAAEGEMPDWDDLFRDADEGFSQTLLRLIDQKGLTDAQCYKRANIDRKLFSKIRSNPAYRPGKPTVFAFAIALELSLDETRLLLDRAGFSLTHSSRFDIILEYFITRRFYDIYRINEVLFRFDMPLLGARA